ncbi:MAG: baseplate J/gp47 family protein [Ezakiella sp.]|nr:baseplate J/gp47 family protein [Ezakiella sp.]
MPKFYAEDILKRCMSRISDDMDKREGSVIYDALMPACMELEALYFALDELYKNAFADTADFNYLKKLGKERGIEVYKATNAIIRGEFSGKVNKGDIFTINKLRFIVMSDCEENGSLFDADLRAERAGSEYNLQSGNLNSLYGYYEVSRIKELLKPARDFETVEEFRERYFKEVRRKNFGGNIEDYERWTLALEGVGAVKVFPIWQGGGTVKVVISGSDGLSPSSKLIDDVQTALDPVKNHGEGVGIAPIGHTVTVRGVNHKTVDIKLKMVFQAGYDKDNTAEVVKKAVEEYVKEVRAGWGKRPLVLRSSNLISRFLEYDKYFVDCEYVSFNDENIRLAFDEEDVPVVGEIEFLDKAPEGMCKA